MEKEKSGFGGIFNKLSKALFTEEYLEANQMNEKPVEKAMPNATGSIANVTQAITPNTLVSSTNISTNAKEEMVNKVHTLLEGINKPGIDFMELWNAAEAMGGVNAVNINNAFVALKIAGGTAVNKIQILDTGKFYSDSLNNALQSDVQGKMEIKNKIINDKAESSKALGAEIVDLNNKITEWQKILQEKNAKLINIDQEFDPKIKEIDEKITIGQYAVQTVITEINQVLELAKTSIKE